MKIPIETMTPLTINDNSTKKITDTTLISLLWEVSDNTIGELCKLNPQLLIFPQQLKSGDDYLADKKIFEITGSDSKYIKTGNIMGFLGVGGQHIRISSRFTTEGSKDFFLYYMLEKVFQINVFNLDFQANKDDVFKELLKFLFPVYLKKALAKGIYKEYQCNEYNDANVKGSIDVNRFIKENVPFNGRIAYSVKEHTYDNRLTQLIRHTIEVLNYTSLGQSILNSNHEVRNCVTSIVNATPSYQKNQQQSVIRANIREIHHPYFFEYRELQQLCMQILRNEGIAYDEQATDNQVYGLLFDGAWLWEEYLNTLLKDEGFIHPENTNGSKPIYLFVDPKTYRRYPDFYKEGEIVLDAKYKNLSGGVKRDDYHQIVTYMHILEVKQGGFIYPYKYEVDSLPDENSKTLNGYGGDIFTLGFPVNAAVDSYQEFKTKILDVERRFLEKINKKT